MSNQSDEQWAFDAYEAVRARLPRPDFGSQWHDANTLADIADDFDVFLLDAFGVLNIGETAIQGAAERICDLRDAGKRVLVVSNAAGYPKRILIERYTRLGFEFTPEDVVTSRDALLGELATHEPIRWGIMASQRFGMEELEHLECHFLTEDPASYDNAEGFLLIGAAEWTQERQELLVAATRKNPRPVLVGNPDIVAPREDGLSREPGFYAHGLADETGIKPAFFGKPFASIYDLALARLGGKPDRSRILMVGDTLHTDVLGGRAAGVRTALVAGYGSLATSDVSAAIKQSAIVPDFVIQRP